jgi:uncharacterized DUF497 family protein
MKFIWDESKNQKLESERGVRFEDVVLCVKSGEVVEILKNPSKDGQFYMVVALKGYTHVVPFLINQRNEIILKTIFPSRKFHKKYGDGNEEQKNHIGP